MTNESSSTRTFKVYVPAILLALVAIGLIAGAIALMRTTESKKTVTSFAECRAAGGSVMESYPEQCSLGGQTYVNEQQLSVGSEYVGLSEADALAKAKDENVIARVVERDGDGMTVTMDFLLNRHNLYVKNGKVYKVDVEGVAKDTPAATSE
ncbi:MAG: hypothetical protein WBP22_03010 [Candidatus Saccharimonas sp.]